ncbi:BTB/POZ domain-containing protein 1-like [Neocloeon triangulifer]|uniref:BTB/POZ domain-containing protein 1-like n=1 Tax=Neocloeon triangulifer TaxID=2078957 RepID=UPI00286FAE73|nr:BTB/POZ domain-containing protein 1-like [Neocloeon triangulifer]
MPKTRSRSSHHESNPKPAASKKSKPAALDKEEWKRSGDLPTDYLHLFESSSMYDCTFRVEATPKPTNNASHLKVFKCHKLVLSVASKVFEVMFHGEFAEASKGPDDKILIEDTPPAVFETAMRFVYGRKTDFKSEVIAAEVYKFADKWQICSLKDSADLFLKDLSTENVAFVHKIFKQAGNKKGLERCMKVISENTQEVLKSSHWKNATLDLVIDVLSQEDLSIENECALLEGLYRWGEANTKDRIENPSDAMVREAINKPLEKIRFLSMEYQDFANFCLKNKNCILSAEEKLNIMMSISTGSMENLPKNFSIEKKSRITLKNATWLNLQANYWGGNAGNTWLEFTTNKRVRFLGFQFMSFNAYLGAGYQPKNVEYELTNAQGVKIYKGTTNDYDENLKFYRTKGAIYLDAGFRYKISVKQMQVNQKCLSQYFSNLSITKDTLTVQLFANYSGAGIGTLIFS